MASRRAPRSSDSLLELGSTGLKRTGGSVYEEWHRKLTGTRGIKTYREMSDNSAVLGALLFAIEMFIRAVDWNVNSASEEDEKALEAAKFLEECLEDMSHTWSDFLAEVLTMLVFGWSYFEIVYKRRGGPDQKDPRYRSKYNDGRFGWRKLAIRSQESLDRWEFDEDGGIRGMWQVDIYSGRNLGPVFIPIEKALHFRTKSNKNNPEGRSLLRNAYRSYYFESRLEEIEAIGIERELAGLPVMQVPVHIMKKTASADDRALRAAFETLIRNIRTDEQEGVLIPCETDHTGNPTGYKLSLLSTGGRRAIDPGPVIERYARWQAMTVLHDWVMLGQSSVGSFALASTKTEASSFAVQGILDSIADVLNRFAIPKLFELNPDFSPEVLPTLVFGDIETPPLQEIAEFVLKLVNAGAIEPDRALERRLRQLGNLPEPEEDKNDLRPDFQAKTRTRKGANLAEVQ